MQSFSLPDTSPRPQWPAHYSTGIVIVGVRVPRHQCGYR